MPQNILKSPKWLVGSIVIVVLLITSIVLGVNSLGGPGYILAGDDDDEEDGRRPKVISTQIYLVRHAEQTEDKTDLLPEGYDRAALLAERLTRARVTHVCSSHLNRAFQTVRPTAEDHGLTVNQLPEPGSTVDSQVVDQSTSSSASIEPMVEFLLDLPSGSVAVCAGHSGTLLAIMAGLGVEVDPNCDYPRDNCVPGTKKEDFPGGYDNLWVVIPGVATDDDQGRPKASLVNLRYGDPEDPGQAKADNPSSDGAASPVSSRPVVDLDSIVRVEDSEMYDMSPEGTHWGTASPVCWGMNHPICPANEQQRAADRHQENLDILVEKLEAPVIGVPALFSTKVREQDRCFADLDIDCWEVLLPASGASFLREQK